MEVAAGPVNQGTSSMPNWRGNRTRHLSAVGLSVTSKYEDKGQNPYFDVSQDCLIVDEKASRRGRTDSEGAGAKLCGKSTADSRRVGA
jgi:hypothetical protein